MSWTETNSSTVDCVAFTDVVQVFDLSNTVVFEQSIDRPVLESGGSTQGSVQATGLPMGGYIVYVTTNSAGIDAGAGQPTAQGYKGYANAQVGVGGADVSGRASSPAEADRDNFLEAYTKLLDAYNSRGEDAIRSVAHAL